MLDPAYNQTDFRGRNDNGGEAGATWNATTNTDWTQFSGEIWRLRFVIAEVNGVKENVTEWQLQYNLNAAGWNNVTTTSAVVQAVPSSYFADGDATTQQIGTGTFVAGVMSENGIAGDVNPIDFAGSDETEFEWALNFVGADVAEGDTVQFRVIKGDGTVLSYTNTPTVTVSLNATISVSLASTISSAVDLSSTITKTISGTCAFDGVGVPATLYIVDTTNDTVVKEVTADADGTWSASVEIGITAHVAAQYDDGTDKYNEYSKPFLVI